MLWPLAIVGAEIQFLSSLQGNNSLVSTVSWKLAEDIWGSCIRDKGLNYSLHRKQHEHQHVCLIFFPCFHDPWWQAQRNPGECYVCSRFVLQLRNTEFDEPSIVSTVSILALWSRGRYCLISSSLVAANKTLRNGLSNECSGPWILGILKMCRHTWDPWRSISQNQNPGHHS